MILIEELKQQNENLKKELEQLKIHKQNLESILNQITSAKTFKLWQRYNKVKKLLILSIKNPKKILKAIKILFTQGPKELINKIKTQEIHQQITLDFNQQYQIWYQKNYPTKEILKKQKLLSKKFKYKPKISIITPVYNTNPKWLTKCINSVLNQTYQNFELILINDGSTDYKTFNVLKSFIKKNKKITLINFKKNKGISFAIQIVVDKSKVKFIGLLDSDDELATNALYEIVYLLNKNKRADFIYSDEDKIDENGIMFDPFFKPDWSPDLLRSMMYTSHFSVYRKSLINKVGGFKDEYVGSQDYDIALKISEITKNIFHIPKILYHWRSIPTSAAYKGDVKGYPINNAKKALKDHLKRTKIKAKVEKGCGIGRWRVRYQIIDNTKVSSLSNN